MKSSFSFTSSISIGLSISYKLQYESYIESLLICYKKEAKSKSMALLNSSFNLFEKRCLGHIPEILDGDSPHEQKGCYAQSWGASEYFRIFEFLKRIN